MEWTAYRQWFKIRTIRQISTWPDHAADAEGEGSGVVVIAAGDEKGFARKGYRAKVKVTAARTLGGDEQNIVILLIAEPSNVSAIVCECNITSAFIY